MVHLSAVRTPGRPARCHDGRRPAREWTDSDTPRFPTIPGAPAGGLVGSAAGGDIWERVPTRGGATMTFNEVLSQTIAMLHQHGRVSYRALKRQFAIPDDYLTDLTDAILFAYPQVRDAEGAECVRAPLAYTPPYLAEKILTSR